MTYFDDKIYEYRIVFRGEGRYVVEGKVIFFFLIPHWSSVFSLGGDGGSWYDQEFETLEIAREQLDYHKRENGAYYKSKTAKRGKPVREIVYHEVMELR